VNAKQKVIDAIAYFEGQQAGVAQQKAQLAQQCQNAAASRNELIRTLKAVYGGRAKSGVVYRGKRYSVDSDRINEIETLSIVEADFEVLG
jgi:hypothetical protein